MSESTDTAEALFDRALEIARRHLAAAQSEAGRLAPYVAAAMIEVAIDAAVDTQSHEDVVDMLRDLARQIEDEAEV